MADKTHAANAKGRANQQLKRGKLGRAAYEKIVAKANRILEQAKSQKREKSKTCVGVVSWPFALACLVPG